MDEHTLLPNRPESIDEVEPELVDKINLKRELGPLNFNNPDDVKKFHDFKKRKK